MVCENSWLRSVALHRHQNTPPSRLYALLDDTGVIPGQRPRIRKLELDILEFDIIHTVRGHRAADRTQNHPNCHNSLYKKTAL